jgi:hypothetical protein
MSWKKHFKSPNFGSNGNISPINGFSSATGGSFGMKNYQSNLPDVYIGHPNRVTRYNQYEQMDAHELVNAALDILAEFSTQVNIENGTAFDLVFNEKPTDNELKIIKDQLKQWYKLNQFDKRIFKLFRNVIKYGDQVFVRDPETFKLLWVEMSKVTKVIVNESDGKSPEQYAIKDLNPNLQNLTVTAVTTSDTYMNQPQIGGATDSYTSPSQASVQTGGSRFSNSKNEAVINAEHIVHLSLAEGLDIAWPFGNSVLETIFKVFKQIELLEDAVIIYRLQRAPERRVFKVDVGNMPSHLAMAFVERVKNEVHQRRMPSQSGNGNSMMDTSYNPISMNEDFFFPQTENGRGSSVEILPGGCLAMDSKVPLLDGRTLNLTELTQEYKDGKENWVYSCDPETGHVVPGIISWAGITQKSAKVLKITLDNGKELIVTPDHKFPIIGKGFVESKDLLVGESMIPFNIQNADLGQNKKREYTQVYQNDTRKWEFVHRMVVRELKDSGIIEPMIFNEKYSNLGKDVTHHKDVNRYNNSPKNLVRMNWLDHKEYHQSIGFSTEAQKLGTAAAKAKLEEMKKDPIIWKKYTDYLAKRSSEVWENYTDEEREIRADNSRKAFIIASDTHNELLQDLEYYEKYTTAQKEGWAKFKDTPEYFERNAKIGAKSSKFMNSPGVREKYYGHQRVIIDKYVLDKVQSIAKGKSTHQMTCAMIVNILNSDSEFLNYYLNLNNNTVCANWNKEGITESQLTMGVTRHGYKNWKQFRKEVELYNHKIVSIEYLKEPIEVGTLTIDVDEKYHNYHTFALESGIFTKNSNLGEITDLRYFSNRLFRGLRIPTSYLPAGDKEESSNNYTDGKVGQAMIQEWRFNQYCKRLQSLIASTLDKEFKMFMRFRGINIDNSVFDLQFNEPQNFTKYRQVQIDTERIQAFQQVEQVPYLSKRFILKRYLDLSEEEMQENEEMWAEEHADLGVSEPVDSSLRSVGISSGGISSDLGNIDDMSGGEDMGGEGAPVDAGQGRSAGAVAPPAQGPM